MSNHDSAYKNVFPHPRAVQDLLRDREDSRSFCQVAGIFQQQ